MLETVCLFGLYGRLIIPQPEIYYRYNKSAFFVNFLFLRIMYQQRNYENNDKMYHLITSLI